MKKIHRYGYVDSPRFCKNCGYPSQWRCFTCSHLILCFNCIELHIQEELSEYIDYLEDDGRKEFRYGSCRCPVCDCSVALTKEKILRPHQAQPSQPGTNVKEWSPQCPGAGKTVEQATLRRARHA